MVTRQVTYWGFAEVVAVSSMSRRVRRGQDIEDCTMSNGFETMDVPAGCWIQCGGWARSRHVSILDKLCRSCYE